MIVRQYAPCSLGRSIICLGKQGEINALRVEFDVSAWMAMYPDATVKLMHFAPDRPQDNPVIPTLGVEGTLRVWIVGEEDTAGAGNGVIELLLIDERTGSTIKSATGYTTVLRSPSAGIEAQEAEAGYVRYDVDQSALLTDEQKAMARKNIGAGTGDGTGSGGILKETDPTVPDWAKQPSKPTYTAGEVGALPSSYTPPVTSVNGKTGEVALNAQDVRARPDTWTPSASDVGADAAGTASGAVAAHNTSGAAHADLRALIEGLTSRLNALADSDDTTLDQLSEIVAYIKSNKAMIDAVTTGKVSASDIVDNLTTNASGKVLSAAQGVALKAMIDGIVIPTALPNPQPITINGQRYDGSEAVTVTVSSEGGGTPVEIDDTLTQSGKAADAKVVGDRLSALNEAIDNVQGTVINQNGGGLLKIWAGTQEEFDAIETKDSEVLYYIVTDEITGDSGSSGGDSGSSGGDGTSITLPNNIVVLNINKDADYQSGELVTKASRHSTDFIDVGSATSVTFASTSYENLVRCYDSSKAFIGTATPTSFATTETRTFLDGTAFIRLVFNSSSPGGIICETFEIGSDTVRPYPTANSTATILRYVDGKSLDSSGNIIDDASTNKQATDYIPVDSLFVSVTSCDVTPYIAFRCYDKDKNYISGSNTNIIKGNEESVNLNDGTAYIRMILAADEKSTTTVGNRYDGVVMFVNNVAYKMKLVEVLV